MKGAGRFRIMATPPGGPKREILRFTEELERDEAFEKLSRGPGWTYCKEDALPCVCRCGYICDRFNKTSTVICMLGYVKCMDDHYKRDCGHDFTGPWVDLSEQVGSTTCVHCGITAIGHDSMVGP